MGKHTEHRAGTVSGCPDCLRIAYEPSWYASMLAFAQERMVVLDEPQPVS